MRHLIPDFILQQHAVGKEHGRFQAAALFADISGYTVLTETLMRHDKDGAEVLSDALYAIFGRLVAIVYHHGGFISLFSGDAVTAIFPFAEGIDESAAEDAAARAMLAAAEIQAFFRPQNRQRQIETPYGTFDVACKIGLSLGDVRWGIVECGDAHTFYFRGDALEGCTDAEQLATSGQVVADNHLLDLLTPNVESVGTAEPGYQLVTGNGLPPYDGRALPVAPNRQALTPFLPDAILDLSLAAEFREVSAIFLRFEAPEDETTLLSLAADLLSLANRYGGYLVQLEFGDKGSLALVLFGAPVAYEQNDVRAARFLVDLRATMDIPLCAGLATGTVWAGFMGGEGRHTYTVIGDIVNLSARLAVKATWGQIWCSQGVANQLRAGFALESLGVLSLKGKAAPQAAFSLISEKRGRADAASSESALVGRTEELAQITGFLSRLNEGRSSGVILVCGEAGIGKSRLVEEVRQLTVERSTWLFCPADRVLQRPFGPFRRMLRTHFELLVDAPMPERATHFDAQLDALLTSLPEIKDAAQIRQELERTRSLLAAQVDIYSPGSLFEQLEPELRHENTMAAYRALVLALTLLKPLVLYVDDVHWLDANSIQLLKMLMSNVEEYPLAVVGTTRYDEQGRIPPLDMPDGVAVQTIELAGLGSDGVQQCVIQALNAEVDESVAKFVAERTNGNPFYVEQLAVDLQERGLLVGQFEELPPRLILVQSEKLEAVPASLNGVLVSRLDRLTPGIKEVVQTASVLGREFEAPVLAAMLPERDRQLADEIDLVRSRQIWDATQNQTYVFRHVLLRDAAYDMQLRAHLRQLHRQAAEAIEVVHADALPPRYGELTHHYSQAQVVEQERTYAGLAGKHAAGEYANTDAIRYLCRAIELTEEANILTRHELRMTLGGVYRLVGEREKARREYEVGLAPEELSPSSNGDEKVYAESCLGMSGLMLQEDPAKAAEWAQQGHSALTVNAEPTIEAMLLTALAEAQMHLAQYEPSTVSVKRALALVPDDADALRFDALLTQSANYYMMAEMEDAISIGQTALALSYDANDLLRTHKALHNLATYYQYSGDWQRAIVMFEEALQIAEQIGDVDSILFTRINLGLLHMDRGDWVMATQIIGETMTEAAARDQTAHELMATLYWSTIKLDHFNEPAEALDLARSVEVRAAALGVESILLEAFLQQAACQMSLEDWARVRLTAERAIELATEIGEDADYARALRFRSRASAAEGDQTAAVADLRQSLSLQQEAEDYFQAALAEADLGLVLAQVGSGKEAVSHLISAGAVLSGLSARPALADVTARALRFDIDLSKHFSLP